MPILEASHLISNDLGKLGSVKIGVLVNISFKPSKALMFLALFQHYIFLCYFIERSNNSTEVFHESFIKTS